MDRPSLRLATSAVVVAVALASAACSSGPSVLTTSTTAKPKPAAPVPLLYVSLGDSYAAGYQPSGPHSGRTDTNGFAYQIPGLAARKGDQLALVNFGCGGATTTSILHSVGCGQLGPGATPYPTESQAAAAEAFLLHHRGKIGLITVSIGGNDVTRCVGAASVVACVTAAVVKIKRNLAVLLDGLRSAAGPSVPIVGTTYPDVILGLDLSGQASQRSLAKLSVVAFKDLINPALEHAYSAVHADFVDVTAATGAYGSLSRLTDLQPYGRIPVPVARVCELTYFCQYHDIHPRTAGYKIIAELVVATLPAH
ncbi:MAG: GDSL-type esterase/lipase family protein [Acidimicrobiales bacterium]|jgi:lysophospholipase L1-like esterase